LVVLGLGALAAAVVLGQRVLRVRSWPTTAATVVERVVGPPEGPTGGTRNARFVPRLRLAIVVDGVRHESTGRRMVQETMTAEEAQAWVAAVPDGLVVHYNPDDPSESYLEPGSLLVPIALGLVGLSFALAGVLR
jgi:hypothetical protein